MGLIILWDLGLSIQDSTASSSHTGSIQMTPERWQQVKAILAEAIECDGALRRAAVVESSCVGDTLLKQEVEALLAYADKPAKIRSKNR
jgi:hypothetical protein